MAMAAKLHKFDPNLSSGWLLHARDKRKEKTRNVSTSPFIELLDQESIVDFDEQQNLLKDYLEKIKQTGWKLQKTPTYSVLREYKRLIQGFLQQSLKGLYQLEEEVGRLNYSTGQRKKYSLIKVIDEKLGELIQAVLTEQNANLLLLQRIEEINGLLINLLS